MAANRPIPVIDLFAGPGGLGEGFASLGRPEGTLRFDIRLSIEMDPIAHQTLELRAFFRQFDHGNAPTDYYDHLRGELSRDELFNKHPQQAAAARNEAWHAELGKIDPAEVRERITSALDEKPADRSEKPAEASYYKHDRSARSNPLQRVTSARSARSARSNPLQRVTDPWALIGGPPCQAYSLVGRSRNKGIEGYTLEKDPKARLYLEYLQLIADFWPAVFVMETVKGLLSSKIDGEPIFNTICDDIRDPAEALKKHGRTRRNNKPHTYSLHALTREALFESSADFVIRCELYGIPQARHHIIVVGIRDDVAHDRERLKSLTPRKGPTVEEMIGDLPELRSGLSKEPDSPAAWVEAALACCQPDMLHNPGDSIDTQVLKQLDRMPTNAKKMANLGRGAEFIEWTPSLAYESDWFIDPKLGGICNHATRSHIRSDLHRPTMISVL